MQVLITGITGFAGSHLTEFLLTKPEIKIYGLIRWRSQMGNISHLLDKIELIEGDIGDVFSIRKAIQISKPDYIFHLAAQSFVPTSWNAPQETLITNIIGELNIFEEVRNAKINPRIQIACSSEEYGFVNEEEIPIKETNPLRPLSPYGVSKVAQDLLGYQYFKSYQMEIVRTRAFNHTGPRRADVFVCSNFAKQIALIEKGKQTPEIKVGNLEAIRDFTDVRDIVKGYWLSLEKGEAGEVYNLCSQKGYKIKEVLNMLLKMTDKKIKITVDPQKLRPSDVPVLIGDYSKFKQTCGWEPKITFTKTLEELLDYWRKRV